MTREDRKAFLQLQAEVDELRRHTAKLPSRGIGGGGSGAPTHHYVVDLFSNLPETASIQDGDDAYVSDSNRSYDRIFGVWERRRRHWEQAADPALSPEVSIFNGDTWEDTDNDFIYLRIAGAWKVMSHYV